MGEDFLGEVFAAIPESTETVRNHDRQYSRLSFVGRPFRKEPSVLGGSPHDQPTEWVSGTIRVNIAWGVDEFGHSLGPSMRQLS